MAKPDRMTPDEIKTKLEGPVMSIPTSFLADGAIDYDGVANVIETGIDGGTQVALLTVGDSQFAFMREQEVADITQLRGRSHGRTRDGCRRNGTMGNGSVRRIRALRARHWRRRADGGAGRANS